MLDKILPYEENLFFLINGTPSYFMDNIMCLYSNIKVWIPIAIMLIVIIIFNTSWTKWLPAILAIIVVLILCEQFSSHIMKPLFEKPRFTHYPGIMEPFRYTRVKYGIISGHTTTAFGIAIFTLLLFRNRYYGIIIMIWAALVSYSRVYLGVHFISDITAGAISGLIIGTFVYKLYQFANTKIVQYFAPNTEITPYETYLINFLAIAVLIYMLFVPLYKI